MRRCLVTGASGHLGVALVKALKENNEYVKVLIRNKDCLTYINDYVDEVVYGDITNTNDILEACQSITVVFHLAALITVGREHKELLEEINVKGTENVVHACLSTGVEKLIYVSSAHALDFKDKNEIIKEKEYIDIKGVKGYYAKSKATASNYVKSANGKTLKTIICLPTAIIGPYAYKDSHFNEFLNMYGNNKLRIYLKGEYNFIDVRDASNAIYNASISGVAGESYILSGEVMTVKEMFDCLAPVANVKCPKIKIPLFLLRGASHIFEVYYHFTKAKPLFTSHAIYTLNSNAHFDNQKAVKDLDLSVRSAKESLIEHYQFIRKKNKT